MDQEYQGHWGHSHSMGWSKEMKIAHLEKKEKILEAELEFIRKIKENLKKMKDVKEDMVK